MAKQQDQDSQRQLSDSSKLGKMDEATRQLLVRLRRVEGQLRGLQKAILSGKGCEQLIPQYLAVRAALDSAGLILVEREIERCLEGVHPDRQKLDQLLRLCLRVRPRRPGR